MDGYIDFRFALKESEVLAREVLEKEKPIYAAAQEKLAEVQKAVDAFSGSNEADKARLELRGDEALDRVRGRGPDVPAPQGHFREPPDRVRRRRDAHHQAQADP